MESRREQQKFTEQASSSKFFGDNTSTIYAFMTINLLMSFVNNGKYKL